MSTESPESREQRARADLAYATSLAAARGTPTLEADAIRQAVEAIVAAYRRDEVPALQAVQKLGAALIRAQDAELQGKYASVKGQREAAARAHGYHDADELRRRGIAVANVLHKLRLQGKQGNALPPIKKTFKLNKTFIQDQRYDQILGDNGELVGGVRIGEISDTVALRYYRASFPK